MSTEKTRIDEIVSLIPDCREIADIGCDHAYVCIRAVKEGKAARAYACDLNRGPLEKAAENIKRENLEGFVIPVLSDGLKELPLSPQVCVIAGMGGLLIRDILENGREKLRETQTLLLGPHTEQAELRRYLLQKTPFRLTAEKVVKEQGKFYVLMAAERGGLSCPSSPEFLLCGDPNLQLDREAYGDYLTKQLQKTKKAAEMASAGAEGPSGRKAEKLKEELALLEKVYESISV